MSTGSITITPGKVFNTVLGERVDLTKLNLLGTPTARVNENSIGRRELITAFVEQVDDATAGLANEIIVRAAADSALAGDISSLSATVGGNTAAITAESIARATADGFLEGKYALQVTAGDVVTGMIITSASGAGTPVSQVRFQADKFQIWNGTAGVPVFDLSGSTIRLAADVTILGRLDVGTGIDRAFVGEISAGNYTIRRGVAAGNRVELASNDGGGAPNDYAQFRAFNSGNQLVAILGTEQTNGFGLLQLFTAAGAQTLGLDGSVGRVTAAESFRGPAGSAGSPPYTFTGRTSDGFYSVSDGATAISSGGQQAMEWARSINDFSVKIGQGRAGNGAVRLDFISDSTYTSYGLRIERGGGADQDTTLYHRGLGELVLAAQDSGGNIRFAAGTVFNDGDLRIVGTRWLYINNERVLRERFAGTPATLGDVIDVLQHHGLCN